MRRFPTVQAIFAHAGEDIGATLSCGIAANAGCQRRTSEGNLTGYLGVVGAKYGAGCREVKWATVHPYWQPVEPLVQFASGMFAPLGRHQLSDHLLFHPLHSSAADANQRSHLEDAIPGAQNSS